MRGFKRFEISETPYSSLFYTEAAAAWWPTRTASLFADDEAEVEHLGFSLDILNPSPSPFDLHLPFLRPRHALPSLGLIESAAAVDLIYSSSAALRRYQERAETDLFLQGINDRVTALELGFDRTLRSEIDSSWDRKYKWTAEIQGAKKDGFDKKYKWTTEVKGGEERNFKWTAEIKGKGKDAPASCKYTFQASTAPGKGAGEEKKKEKEKEKKGSRSTAHVVEIEEQPNPGAIVIRKAFNRRAVKLSKGKRKELSPQDAALIIQMSFRAYLVRRSQVLRGLRDLAVAKAKLKEIRALFSSFSYRRRIVIDAVEHQRFSEKIIVLLLTVDAIEGPDYMVRAAKKSMVEELEAMLEVVDPQPPGKLGSMKRRRFDLPDGGPISKELSTGVAEVVQMLDREDV